MSLCGGAHVTHHHLALVRASPAATLCREDPHLTAHAGLGHGWRVYDGLHERQADALAVQHELQRRDGLMTRPQSRR